MRNTLIALLVLPICAASAASAPISIEGLRSGAVLALPKAQNGFKASRYVSLNGYLSLRGNSYIREGATYVRVDLSGNTRLNGAGASTNTIWVRHSANIYLRKGQTYVNETIQVSEYVSVYDRGRYVGSTRVSGSIRVSGHVTGNYLRLNGSGSLRGSLFVRDQR